MPIYMDRHDVSELVTAEHVAQLHQEDLKIQHQFGCRALTYWFDNQRKTAFCLIEAPDKATIEKMHNKAHGQIPHSIIEVEANIVESFLGRIEDPQKAKDSTLNIINDPAFRTIMVIRLDYFSLIDQPDSLPIKSFLAQFKKSVSNLLTLHEGKLAKQQEPYFIISFTSVSRALQAALTIETLVTEVSRSSGLKKVPLKIGISTGVPVTDKNLIFEDAIKLAQRMCKVIPGEIIVSSEVKQLFTSENSTTLPEGGNIVALTQANEKFLTYLMDYADSAWQNSTFTVEDFSKHMGYSKAQLYRKLTDLTGTSPNAFIKEYRLQEALTLLNKQTSNISEVAFATGFSSPAYFSKCFQKRYGYSPSDYVHSKLANS
ncbi:DUF4242 domain-containing protein [Spirosoma aureum]|uniref:DUF4242 domain-containing protein n=1 Tax=Spirosoma aureum TaxID=2692134 RepID=A0A6G9AUV0_9BACT|nr:nickel-binding protein [Spirosoma aureum]QIP16251.1 DUF4242 domain-containing protein [Spirosoma aureum]